MLRWFGCMDNIDKHHIAGRVSIAEWKASGLVDGRCEGGLRKQRDNVVGYMTLHKGWEVESLGAFVSE